MQTLNMLIKRIAAFFAMIAAFFASLFGQGPARPVEPPPPEPAVPVLEETYAADGPCDVSHLSFPADEGEEAVAFEIWYPAALETEGGRFPMALILNGTGRRATDALQTRVLRHFASYGIIAVGNEDPNPATGASAEQTLRFMRQLAAEPGSVFFGRLDESRIAVAGYSQGGAAALRTASVLPCAEAFSAVVAVSPSNEERAAVRGGAYDPAGISAPVLLLAGAQGYDENEGVTSLAAQRRAFEAFGGPKGMGRRIGTEHNESWSDAVGYVTAWLSWRLCGDQTAAGAFTGPSPELARDPEWQDVRLAF